MRRFLLIYLVGGLLTGLPVTRGASSSGVERSELVVQVGRATSIESLAFSPDGRLLAVGDALRSIQLWNPQTREVVRNLYTENGGAVASLAFSPDRKLLAAVSTGYGLDPGGLSVWDATTGERLYTARAATSGLAFSPNGRLLATGVTEKGQTQIKVVNPRTGKVKQTLPDSDGYALAFSRAGLLASVGRPGSQLGVRLWNPSKGQLERTLDGTGLQSVAFSPDGRTLAAGSAERAVTLWDVGSGRPRQTLQLEKPLATLAFSRDGKSLATSGGGDGGELKLWSVESGTLLRELDRRDQNQRAVAFSPDGKRLASGGWDRRLSLWQLPSKGPAEVIPQAAKSIEQLSWCADGTRLAVLEERGGVQSWDMTTGRMLARYAPPGRGAVNTVAWSPNGGVLAVGSGDAMGGALSLYERDAHKPSHVIVKPQGIEKLAFSPDGSRIAAATTQVNPNVIEIRDRHTARLLRILRTEQFTGPFIDLAFSPDGKLLAICNYTSVEVWDLESGELRQRQKRGDAYKRSAIAFTEEGLLLGHGSRLEYGDSEPRISVLEPTSGGKKRELTLPGLAEQLVFSTTGELVATKRYGGLRLWEVNTGAALGSLPDEGPWISAAALLGRRRMALGYRDGTVRIYELPTAKLLVTLTALPTNAASGEPWITWTPSGQYLASPGIDQFVRLRTNARLLPLLPNEGYAREFQRPELIRQALARR